MSCNSEDILANISLKKHFWKDLKGVSKKSFILKDPVDVEEYTGSLNESLLILCSSRTKSRVEECDKSGQNSSCKYCESSMYIVHVCLAPGGSPMDCWGRSS